MCAAPGAEMAAECHAERAAAGGFVLCGGRQSVKGGINPDLLRIGVVFMSSGPAASYVSEINYTDENFTTLLPEVAAPGHARRFYSGAGCDL